jgi:transposase
MIQIAPQMRIMAAIEPADFRRGIDGLARLCNDVLKHDPFNGWVFVFRNQSATALKVLVYLCPCQLVGTDFSVRCCMSRRPRWELG